MIVGLRSVDGEAPSSNPYVNPTFLRSWDCGAPTERLPLRGSWLAAGQTEGVSTSDAELKLQLRVSPSQTECTPSVSLRLTAPSRREPLRIRMLIPHSYDHGIADRRRRGSLFEGAGWPQARLREFTLSSLRDILSCNLPTAFNALLPIPNPSPPTHCIYSQSML